MLSHRQYFPNTWIHLMFWVLLPCHVRWMCIYLSVSQWLWVRGWGSGWLHGEIWGLHIVDKLSQFVNHPIIPPPRGPQPLPSMKEWFGFTPHFYLIISLVLCASFAMCLTQACILRLHRKSCLVFGLRLPPLIDVGTTDTNLKHLLACLTYSSDWIN